MNILVTGGAGYIGSHTCKALAKAGYSPVVYDNFSTGHRELVRWGKYVYGDVLDTPLLIQTMKEFAIQGVIHFAALSQVGESVNHPAKYYKNNITGTLSLLEAMRLCAVPNIVVSSTCAVYGLPDAVPIREDCKLAPVNPYGMTKAVMETMMKDFSSAYGLRGIALRYFNAAGCDIDGETGEWHLPETHLIPRVIMAARKDVPSLRIFGNDYKTKDGTCIRDYIHVADLADAHVRALEHSREIKSVVSLNLGTGRGFSVKEIVAAAERVLGTRVPHEWHGRREGDPPILVADAEKARQFMGWSPLSSDLDTIIKSAASWYDSLRTARPALL